jgi:hypothetical protein
VAPLSAVPAKSQPAFLHNVNNTFSATTSDTKEKSSVMVDQTHEWSVTLNPNKLPEAEREAILA